MAHTTFIKNRMIEVMMIIKTIGAPEFRICSVIKVSAIRIKCAIDRFLCVEHRNNAKIVYPIKNTSHKMGFIKNTQKCKSHAQLTAELYSDSIPPAYA